MTNDLRYAQRGSQASPSSRPIMFEPIVCTIVVLGRRFRDDQRRASVARLLSDSTSPHPTRTVSSVPATLSPPPDVARLCAGHSARFRRTCSPSSTDSRLMRASAGYGSRIWASEAPTAHAGVRSIEALQRAAARPVDAWLPAVPRRARVPRVGEPVHAPPVRRRTSTLGPRCSRSPARRKASRSSSPRSSGSGDVVLVPEIFYPVYARAAQLAGGDGALGSDAREHGIPRGLRRCVPPTCFAARGS